MVIEMVNNFCPGAPVKRPALHQYRNCGHHVHAKKIPKLIFNWHYTLIDKSKCELLLDTVKQENFANLGHSLFRDSKISRILRKRRSFKNWLVAENKEQIFACRKISRIAKFANFSCTRIFPVIQ